MNKLRCCEQVPDRHGGWSWSQCQRTGVVTSDGKLYCKQHDPVARKAKSDAKYEVWKAEREVIDRKRRLELAAPGLLLALRHIACGSYDPRDLAETAIAPFAEYDLTEKDKSE